MTRSLPDYRRLILPPCLPAEERAVSDDLAHRLESLQRSLETLPADLGKKLDKLDKQLVSADRQLAGLSKSAQEAAAEQRKLQLRLDALDRQVASYIEEDRAARRTQHALTALVDARADHDRRFGHHHAVRRAATGMLRAMTTGTVSPAALLGAAEQLMIGAPEYWLPPALVALAAWAGDSQAAAGRAVLEAVSRDPGRSALFFSLTLARFGRQATAAGWITEYARALDRNALPGEFKAVLDAVARGALGGGARERLLDACRSWRDQAGPSGTGAAKQVASWTGFIGGQRRPLTDTFDALRTVSRDWATALGTLEAATAFGHTEQWLEGRLAVTGESDEALRDVTDGLLRELIAAPDQAECALLEAARKWQAIVASGGHEATPPSGEQGRTDFPALSTAIAMGARQDELSEQAARFCLMLSATSAERAVTDLSQRVRSTTPASIEVEIEGWRYAIEPADEPADLVQKFLGWADEELATARAQASRKWLGIGRPSARPEQIEMTWEERKHRGHEAVYQATFQANRYFQKWNKELEAADRCVSLLRTGAAGARSDAQEPDAVPGPSRAGMELPDWDPRPPGP
jgi:regulator of replication initiation timing